MGKCRKTFARLLCIALSSMLQACGTLETSSLALQERQSPLLEEIDNRSFDACGGNGQESLAMKRTTGMAYGTVEAPSIETHLNRIKDRLLSAAGLKKCEAMVYLVPQQHYAAVSTADGGIFLPLGLVRDLESDDEVAALIAHELAHVVLGHHQSDAYFESQKKLLNTGSKVAFAVAVVASQGRASGQFGQFLARNNVTHGITETIVAPSWTRLQENEADMLGMDILIAADYNKAGFFSLLQRMAVWEKKTQKLEDVTAKLSANFGNIMTEASEDLDLTQAENYDSLGNSLTKTSSRLIDSVATFGEGKAKQLGETHHPATERLEAIKAYTRKLHRDAGRPPLGTDAWRAVTAQGTGSAILEAYASAAAAKRALDQDQPEKAAEFASASIIAATRTHAYPRLAFYQVRKAQNRTQKAELNLRIAMKNEKAPLAVYRTMAWLLVDKGSFPEAKQTVQLAMERLSNPPWFLPDAIAIMDRAGEQNQVRRLIAQCEASNKEGLITRCRAAGA